MKIKYLAIAIIFLFQSNVFGEFVVETFRIETGATDYAPKTYLSAQNQTSYIGKYELTSFVFQDSDIDDEDDIEGVESDEIEVEEGKDEDFDLTLVVPGDFEDGNEFILYVKAYEDGHEDDHCYEEYIEVELEREDHHVVIEDFTISPSVTEQGNTIGINVEIKNFGTKDEDDIVVTVKNTALDMDLREEGIDLEEYDDDDDAVIHFTFAIPEDIPGDDYTLTATLDYGHGSDTETAVLKIIGEGGSEAVVFVDNGESVGSSGAVGVTGGSVAQVEFEGKSNMYVITLIILMIIVILLIIWMIKALTKI